MRNQSLRVLTFAGMLTALSFVLKLYLSFTTFDLRITFYEIPILIGSIFLGPLYGLFIAIASDFVYITLAGFPFSPFMALSAAMWGVIPFVLKNRVDRPFILFGVIAITSLIAFSLNSYQLYLWTGSGMWALFPLRLLIVILKWPLQVMIVKILYQRLKTILS
jgi:ECF transporter S component (folate family)